MANKMSKRFCGLQFGKDIGEQTSCDSTQIWGGPYTDYLTLHTNILDYLVWER